MTVGWGSFWDGRSRAPLRIGLAAIAGLELFVESWQIAWQSRDPGHYPPAGAIARALASVPAGAWIVYALIAFGLLGVALDRRPVLAGAWALGWASLQSAWQTEIFASPSRNAFFPGAALLGWVLGQLWASTLAGDAARERRDFRERLAEAGALACLAAAYVGSCASKLLSTGLQWSDAAQVRALVLRQQPLADWNWLLAYRDAVIEQPAVASFAAATTLVIEGGAFLLLLGPRLRLVWAVLLVGLHLNILVLCTMPYFEPIALLLLFAPPWPRILRAAGRPDDRWPGLEHAAVPPRMALVLVAIVGAAWLLAPWGWRA